MQTTLCFDFGNSRLKCAVIENGEISQIIKLEDDSEDAIEKVIIDNNASKSILSSVIEHNVGVEEILKSKTHFHKLSHESKLPFTTPVGRPMSIGADRLALSAIAVHMFPHMHNLVICLGSCITYNFISRFHEFLGGSISPGMHMRFRSMHEYTAKLPMVEAIDNFPLVGYNTATNMLSGVILGMAAEIDGIIDLYKKRYRNFNVLLTGGDMRFFVPHIKSGIFANAHLIYKGLYVISELNN